MEGATAAADEAVRPRFLGVVAAAVRVSVSTETIRRWVRAGRLTAHRPIGEKILIDLHELDALILASADRTVAEQDDPRKRKGPGHTSRPGPET